jgi:hypothetical protein
VGHLGPDPSRRDPGLTPSQHLVTAGAAVTPRPLPCRRAIDVQSLDALGELADQLAADGIALSLASVRVPVHELLERSGVSAKVRIDPTVDAAIARAITPRGS